MVSGSYLRLLKEFSTSTQECQCGPTSACTLECLCRPRFFAGQLLTDDDLNRLEHYIVAKDRLHNRYLHGTGVVCGLEVICNACDDTVTVKTGYAIGPCGEDIIVCSDTSVDVGELIREFRKQQAKQRSCTPSGDSPNQDCEAAQQQWVLSICYNETASRGVTSLKTPPKKSGSCGCGCSSGAATTTTTSSCGCTSGKSATPPQCEPTLTCEGYTFKVTKVKPTSSFTNERGAALSELTSKSELARRVVACLLKLVSQIQQIPSGQQLSNDQLSEFCCDFKSDLRDVIETGAVHDCTLYSRLNAIVCPDPTDQNFDQEIAQAIGQMFQIAVELFRSCVCSALLPACPADSPDACVPLATLTVRAADLRVLRICNWDARKFVITMPTLGYWLGWLPIFDTIRETVVKLCCAKARDPQFTVGRNLGVTAVAGNIRQVEEARMAEAAAPAAGDAAVNEKNPGAPVYQLGAQYINHADVLSGLEATVLGALGGKDGQGNALATDNEILNPFAALALTHITAPTMEAILPTDLINRIFGQSSSTTSTNTDATGFEARMAKMEETMTGLQKTIETQRKTIATLQKKG